MKNGKNVVTDYCELDSNKLLTETYRSVGRRVRQHTWCLKQKMGFFIIWANVNRFTGKRYMSELLGNMFDGIFILDESAHVVDVKQGL